MKNYMAILPWISSLSLTHLYAFFTFIIYYLLVYWSFPSVPNPLWMILSILLYIFTVMEHTSILTSQVLSSYFLFYLTPQLSPELADYIGLL